MIMLFKRPSFAHSFNFGNPCLDPDRNTTFGYGYAKCLTCVVSHAPHKHAYHLRLCDFTILPYSLPTKKCLL